MKYNKEIQIEGKQVGECSINVNGKTWTIASWFVKDEYQNRGYGRKMLKACMVEILKSNPYPNRIEYVWNGENYYVFNWLESNFAPVSMCPLSVRKYANDDDWESHIYLLDVDKVLEYFELCK